MERVGGHLTVKPFDRHHDMASGQGPARCGVITAALSTGGPAGAADKRVRRRKPSRRRPRCNNQLDVSRREIPCQVQQSSELMTPVRAADSASAAEAHSIEGVDEAALETQKGFTRRRAALEESN